MSVAASIPEAAVQSPATSEPINHTVNLLDRLGIILCVVVLAGGIIALATQTLLAVRWYNTPFSGVMWMDGLMVDDSQPLNGTWAGLQAGLRPGDQLLDLTDANGNTTQFSTASDDGMSGMGGMGSMTGQAATNKLAKKADSKYNETNAAITVGVKVKMKKKNVSLLFCRTSKIYGLLLCCSFKLK